MFLDTLTSIDNIKEVINDINYVPLGTVSSNFVLQVNKITSCNITDNYTLTLPTIYDDTESSFCILDFTTSNAQYPSITNTNIKKLNGLLEPFYTAANTHNRLIFTSINGSDNWEVKLERFG